MQKITISKEEYEELKQKAFKISLIDKTIHENTESIKLMKLQEKQKSLEFLHDSREDIYSEKDLKETNF
jgi:phage pi2 protein 07